jgi:hypothetical protein
MEKGTVKILGECLHTCRKYLSDKAERNKLRSFTLTSASEEQPFKVGDEVLILSKDKIHVGDGV